MTKVLVTFAAVCLSLSPSLLRAQSKREQKLRAPLERSRIKWPVDDESWFNRYVAHIIGPADVIEFRELTGNVERADYIEKFWSCPESRKDRQQERVGYAVAHFSTPGVEGWKTERGRVHILHGAPDRITTLRSAELWTYNTIPHIGNIVEWLLSLVCKMSGPIHT